MGLFDLFFPQQAQAKHLGNLAASNQHQVMAAHQQRVRDELQRRAGTADDEQLESRVAQLEKELEQTSLVVESLMRLLEKSGAVKREDIIQLAQELNLEEKPAGDRSQARTQESPPPPVSTKKPFVPKRKWDDPLPPT